MSTDIINELLFSQEDLMLDGYEFFITDKNFNVSGLYECRSFITRII